MNIQKRRFTNPNAIPTRVLAYMAWKNLMHKKMRAFLTIFGVVIGIGAIFFLLSFGIGLQSLVTNEVIGNQSIKSIDVTTTNSKIIKLDQAGFDKMKHLPHVVQAGKSYSYAASMTSRGSEVDAIVYGDDPNYTRMNNPTLTSGRLLNNEDTKGMLINASALNAVGLPSNQEALGKKLSIKIPLGNLNLKDVNDTFTIVGIVDTRGGNEIVIPSKVFSTAGADTFKQVKIEVDSASNVTALRKQIESLGFITSSPLDTIEQINQVFSFFNVVLAGFGGIGMIVAVLGMFNTLTISLLERTKEVGLMITLGARHRDMRKLFVFEALLLSFIGAVIGILGAIIIGQIINVGMNALSHQRGITEYFQLFATPWWLIAGLILFMIAVGLVVVYFPARHASRINPIDALRRE